VADFHRLKDKIQVQAEDVMIGPGSKELMFLLQLVFEGDIILPTPCWVSYGPQSRILGRQLDFIHTRYEDNWRVTPELLKQVYEQEQPGYDRPKLFIFNYPSNPNGSTYDKKELQELAEVAREYGLLILSDEIYGLLHHKGEHISIARYYPEGTIISSGLSKWCGAGGWRLGTFTFPSQLQWLKEAMSVVASETYTSVSSPIQHAAVRAFRGGTNIELYLMHTRRILSTLGQECADMLSDAGIRVHPPVGGFYLFLDFSPLKDELAEKGITDSYQLCEQLLEETGVAILPGAAFERPPEELSARLAYVDFDGDEALTASYQVPLHEELPEDFTKKYCSKVLKGMEQMVQWLKA
jgi:aspartate aminotransferase